MRAATGPIVQRARIAGTGRRLFRRSRHVISEHRHKRRLRDREVSDQSRRGLDWTNFFLADVQMSFGSFLAFYLADLDWSKQDVGLALTVGGLSGLLTQIPGGALADAVPWKRGLAALGIMAIAASALILALRPSYPMVFVAEVLHGVTGGNRGHGHRCHQPRPCRPARHVVPGRTKLPFCSRRNRVDRGRHGRAGHLHRQQRDIRRHGDLVHPGAIALGQIRPEEIDYARARNAAKRDHSIDVQRITDLTKNKNLLLFAGCLMLFHFSNASLLPLVSQNLAHSGAAWSPLLMAGLIIGPQIIVALLAPWIGYWSELWGRKPLLLVGFATQALRALLFAFVTDPSFMIVIQLLDGITGAVVTVLTILIIADLTTGTGRFNLTQGVVGTLIGLAAAISTTVMGFIVQQFGDVAGFLTMAAGMGLGIVLLWTFLPESRPAKYDD